MDYLALYLFAVQAVTLIVLGYLIYGELRYIGRRLDGKHLHGNPKRRQK